MTYRGLGEDDPDTVDLPPLSTTVQSGKFADDFVMGLTAWKTPQRIWKTIDDTVAGRAHMPLAYLLGVITPAAALVLTAHKLNQADNQTPPRRRRRN